MTANKVVLQTTLVLLVCSPAIVQAQLTVFFDNFDGGRAVLPPAMGGFSGYSNTEPVQGFDGLGNPGNVLSGNFLHNPTGDSFTTTPSQKTTLSLSGLPAHTGIQLKFLLAIIDTWDGGTTMPGSFSDIFNVDIDGINRFAETFTNFDFGSQSYVAPPGVLIQRGLDLGFEIFSDGVYDMGSDIARFGSIPHTGSTLTIDFYANGEGWNRPANESWAIDNVGVVLLGVPEPGSAALLAIALVSCFGRICRCQ